MTGGCGHLEIGSPRVRTENMHYRIVSTREAWRHCSVKEFEMLTDVGLGLMSF